MLHSQSHQGGKPAIITRLAGVGSEFSSTSTCWQPACSYLLPELVAADSAHCKHAENENPGSILRPHSELWPRAHCVPFGLSLHSQTESSPWVCLWSLSFSTQLLHTRVGVHLELGVQQGSQDLLCWSLSILLLQVGCCTLLWATEVPYLSWLISQLVKGVPRVTEPLFFHDSLSGLQVSSKLLLLLLFGPTWLCGDLSCSFGCMIPASVQ